MQDSVQLTNITLVTYPSNHVLVQAPKIVLLGSGAQWKDELIKITNNTWVENSVVFYYTENEQYDSDILSWLYLNIKNSDFIIGNISNNDDVSLILPFISNKTTFVINNNTSIFADWNRQFSSNFVHDSLSSIISKIKNLWAKAYI